MPTNEPINTASLQQFIQQVKGADLSNQKEVRLDINTAKQVTYSLATVLARLAGNYEGLMTQKTTTEAEAIEIKVDGGNLFYYHKIDKYSYNMSRPKPTILLEFTDRKSYKSEQVLAAEGIWAVFYKQKPFNLKSANMLNNYPGPKYKKVSFSNPGHAFNLAKKLNTMFNTEDFTVVKLTQGETVSEK
jgi:hypothetical protein